MPAFPPVDRRAPSESNPHLYMYDTFSYTHESMRDPTIHVQTTCDHYYVYDAVPGGKGNPNSQGYTAPASYAGFPASPTDADVVENAIHTARAAAIQIHYRGRQTGAGEFAAGTKSGGLYIKGFGFATVATDANRNAVQFRNGDAYSGTAPFLIETDCGSTSRSHMHLGNVSWSRFSPYNANSIARAQLWSRAFCAELKSQCDRFTLHTSGTCSLCYPQFFMDDNEDYLRAQHFALVQFVNDSNKATFPDYNPASPTVLLGQSIPGFVRFVDMRNMVYEADGVTELDRYKNEKIWAIYSNGQWQEKTFKDKWTEWVARGVFTGLPLPTTLSNTQTNELNAFGKEIQFWAIYRGFVVPFIETFGYQPIISNYQDTKGVPKFDEQWIYRYSNFGYDEQILDCRITQGASGTFDTAAYLAEVQRRIDLLDKDKPIIATFRVRGLSDTGPTYGTWELAAKPLWEYLRHRGIHRFYWYSPDNQIDLLYQAWREFRASIEAGEDAGPIVLGRSRGGRISRSARGRR